MNREDYLEALLTLPDLFFARVSWDGRWVAWNWYGIGPAADVYVAPTDGSAPPLRLTETAEDTAVVSWTPDSRAILVHQDRNGDERYRLYRVDLDRPGVMVPLTEADPNYYLQDGSLHPNGRWLVYGANRDFERDQEIEPTWIYRQDLVTGERRVLGRPRNPCLAFPELNLQGTHVLYNRADLHPSGRQVWMADIEGREDREVVNLGAEAKAFASWYPDGQQAIVRGDSSTHSRIGVWNREDGRLRWLMDDPSRNPEWATVPPGSRHVVIYETLGAKTRSILLDPVTGEETRLPEVRGDLILLAPVGPDEWVAQYSSSLQPTDLVRLSLKDPRPERFVSLARIWERTALTAAGFVPGEDYRWRSTDGLEIQGWLFRARGRPKGTIVIVHGGPTMHSSDRMDVDVQFFAHCGFHVLCPNFRGSTGFGLPFREAIKIDGWGGREQDDIRTGIESLIAAGIAAPGKVGMTGISFGGYAAWWAITHFPPELVAAAAPVCGMTDLVMDYELARPDLRPYSAEMLGGTPQEIPDRYRERSPYFFIDRIRGRTLIVQGLHDPSVTPEQMRAVTRAMDQAGIPFELLAFEDEGHGVTRPHNQRRLYLHLVDFFERAFGDAQGLRPEARMAAASASASDTL